MKATQRPMPRWWLAFVCGLIAAILLWGAYMLPWASWTTFAVITAAVGLVHAATAALALIGHPGRARVWRIQAFASLTYLGYLTYNLFTAASYIAELYGGLGRGVAVSLGLCWVIVVGLTVPVSAWGLAMTGGVRLTRRGRAAGAAGAVLLLLGVWRSTAAASARPTLDEDADVDVLALLQQAVPPKPALRPHEGDVFSLMTDEPAVCDAAPTGPTIVATFLVQDAAGRATPTTRCVQAPELEVAAHKLHNLLSSEAVRGRIKIDVITGYQDLGHVVPVVDTMLIRPGLDGVCEFDRCLMPWQMVALETFNANQPIPVIPDLRFGVSPVHLRKLLAPPDASGLIPDWYEGLTRVETLSFVTDRRGTLHQLRRLRAAGPELTPQNVDRAVHAAEKYILSAQGDDGRFEYKMSPFTGLVQYRGFSLARQAGTTLVVCELARDRDEARAVATDALSMLASTERRFQDFGMLYYPREKETRRIPLGDTALSAIAFLSCRDLVGDRFDPVIDRLTRFLLTMQRPDGSFYPAYDTQAQDVVVGPDPLYAVGQAIFALTLLEELTADEPKMFAEHEQVRTAVERAMEYIATDYWDNFASDFFFMEENWNCLAARASLGHHRHEGYEQFCLDYVQYKTRLILDEADEVSPDFVGGYGFGNVLAPHNTGSAGFGEAGAAALAIMEVRGMDRTELEEELKKILAFLLHHQWDEVSCFACSGPHPVVGAFSEHMASPMIRIDFVQHALAGMGHTGRMLGWVDGKSY